MNGCLGDACSGFKTCEFAIEYTGADIEQQATDQSFDEIIERPDFGQHETFGVMRKMDIVAERGRLNEKIEDLESVLEDCNGAPCLAVAYAVHQAFNVTETHQRFIKDIQQQHRS